MNQAKALTKWLHDKGFFSLLSANFLTQFLGFGTAIFVSKLLTPVELGEIRILQSYAAFFGIFAAFGLNMAVLKFCSEERSLTDRQAILRRSLILAAPTILVTLLVLFILTWLGVITSSRRLAGWLMVYAFTIPLLTVTQILMAYLQALKQINQMAVVQTIIRLQTFVIIVFCVWQWGQAGFVFATIGAYALGLAPLLWQVGWQFWRVPNITLPFGFGNVAWFTMLGGGVTALAQYADIFMLDHFVADRSLVGYYALALTFLSAAMLVTGTVQTIVVPYFSERARDDVWVRAQMWRYQLGMSLLSVGVAGGVYILAWGLVKLFYSASYQPMLTYLSILLIKYVLWSSIAVVGGALAGMGLIRYGFNLVLFTTPVALLLSFVFLRTWGVSGVAWAQVATALLTLLLILVTVPIVLRRFWASPQL